VRHIKFVVATITALLLNAGVACAQDKSFGDRLFHDKAECQFCHGLDGDGHGDPRSPGKAANLHETILNRDQLIEVITCGRPGTEMPHFDKYAYVDDDKCYGLAKADVGKDIPPDPLSTPLTKHEIEAVADYIIANYKGK
jgi:mono/diheme cytochrome c family protein